MWLSFGENLWTHVEVIALFGRFLLFFYVITFKNLLLRNYFREFNESWFDCFLRVSCTKWLFGFFDPLKKMAIITKNRSCGSVSSFSHISPNSKIKLSSVLVKSVQHDEIFLWSNFGENLWTHVTTLFGCFFAAF